MSKIGKLFSRKGGVYVARYVHKKLNNFLADEDKKKSLLKEKKWDNHFIGTDYFVHNLTNTIKVKLYKEDILAKWIYDGFELEEIEFLQKVLKKGDFFIDAGSNIGLFSLVASEIVGSDGKVICFEPSKRTFNRLKENIELNNFLNITPKNLGLSNEPGKLSLNVSENGYDGWNTFAGVTDSRFQKVEEVPVSTIDIEISNLEKNKISVVKIDVEGWEKYVVKGAEFFLKEYSPTLMVEFSEENTFAAGYFIQEVYDILTEYGYHWFQYKKGDLVNAEKKLHYHYDNLIATKNISELRKRINSK